MHGLASFWHNVVYLRTFCLLRVYLVVVQNLEAKAAKATMAVAEPGAARAMEAWRLPSLNV
jgi:hypothetical protein